MSTDLNKTVPDAVLQEMSWRIENGGGTAVFCGILQGTECNGMLALYKGTYVYEYSPSVVSCSGYPDVCLYDPIKDEVVISLDGFMALDVLQDLDTE